MTGISPEQAGSSPTADDAPERKPQDLRGRWQGKFPDFDLDAALYEIRHEWEEELEEYGPMPQTSVFQARNPAPRSHPKKPRKRMMAA
jgi:hypothetical protein